MDASAVLTSRSGFLARVSVYSLHALHIPVSVFFGFCVFRFPSQSMTCICWVRFHVVPLTTTLT